MIRVSIASSENKFVIRLNHNTEYLVENTVSIEKFKNMRTLYVFILLFLAIPQLLLKEITARFHK